MKKMTPKLRSHRKQDKNIISNKNEVKSFERNINSKIEEKSSSKSTVLYQIRLKKQEKRAWFWGCNYCVWNWAILRTG